MSSIIMAENSHAFMHPRSRVSTPRITQRQPLACIGCTRRKLKCDKQVPCSRCRLAGLECAREKVLVSRTFTKHGQELNFLKHLHERLHTPGITIDALDADISIRINALESGNDVAIPVQFDRRQRDNQNLDLRKPTIALPTATLRDGDDMDEKSCEYSAVATLESLAWGRHYGNCYPHRRCHCYSYRSPSEIVSIRSDSLIPATGLDTLVDYNSILNDNHGLLPSIQQSMRLVKFHISHIAWHHGVLHTPTFLEQCEIFWETNTCRHPSWIALYVAVLSSTSWAILNSAELQNDLGITVTEQVSQQLFELILRLLHGANFLEVVSIYSVQAIVLLNGMAHSLGFSDLGATLTTAAIRISQCMGLHKITDPPKSQLSDTEQWHEVIETEIGKRVWCQLMIQDHFGLCFTDSYNINPNHCLTELPKNADDHDLEELDMNVPTITSYMRTLAYIAKLIPRRFDKLGPLWSRKPLIEQYRDVLLGDHDMRQVLGEIPTFLRRGDMTERTIDKPWLDVARRSLAITAAEKIILIHRPFLFLSFQTSHYPHTRSTCVSAAITIVREYSNIIASNHIALWEHSTYCVTASIILCLEVLYPRSGIASHGPAQNYHDLVKSARELLAGRRGDIIANRGVRLIDTMLSVGGIPGSASGSGLAFVSGPQQSRCSTTSQVHLDLQDIVSQFLQGDMLRMDLLEEEWSDSLATDLRLDIGRLGQDFGTWFEGLFGPGQVRPSVYDYLRQP